MKLNQFVKLFVVCLSLTVFTSVFADDLPPRTYAVLSVVGDKLDIVAFEGTTGSNMDTNGHNIIPINDSKFDDAAVMSIAKALRQYQPTAVRELLGSNSEGLYRLQSKLFDTDDEASKGKEYLRAILKGRKATHLILVTKYRTDSKLHVKDAAIGAGKLNGLGFFIDNTLTVRDSQTRQIAHGVLASYAYVYVTLLDAKTLEIVNQVRRTDFETFMNSNPSSGDMNAWSAMPSDKKVEAIKGLLDIAMSNAIPELLNLPVKEVMQSTTSATSVESH